ncbi:response regulator transcription factor [Alkaliphilus peptidifermentans]|uniref:Stage 0 sporulation protein A homolog n=1 Tax=Alkaliphilus peptidifermentans DSM 18978 TaxID=1120976 RepID=A0A1G5J653_9FIRM|nr:response regulator transcription factor [Alkaliphilus peptidifermentans]SCY83855.1 DNA-binding response regulator, OmpR family, contains REC and winged-helix (wHTH) domain [Alkaliphilus peptidifermentans DSM 18978]
MAYKFLIIDDEPLLVKGLKYSLEQDGYEISVASDGQEALDKVEKEKFDLILLDLMLPKIDGLEVCQRIREKYQTPIIMLTAKGEDISKILGLEYGADDYLTKPFNILELKARIKAVLRRYQSMETSLDRVINIDDFTMNTLGRKVTVRGEELNLTAKEFDLLLLLASNPGKVYSREELLEIIWGYEYFGDLRTVDVHIRRLREKIENNSSHPEYILTKWGGRLLF